MARSGTSGTTLDLHVDTPWVVAKYGAWGRSLDDLPDSMLECRDSLKAGGLDSAVFVLYVPDAWHDDGLGAKTLRKQAEWVVQQENEDFTPYLALEGWRSVGQGFIEEYRPKYVTLVHAHTNELAESCTDLTGGGLSQAGREAIRWLQEQGILVDLSHASEQTCWDVLRITEAPLIASHSGTRGVTDHPRNLSDKLILEIAATGGLVGVPLVKNFVGDATGFGRHVEHIMNLIGTRHIAVGSDMDGAVMIPELVSAADWGEVVSGELLKLGLGLEEIRGISGTNALELFKIQSKEQHQAC